MSAHGLPLLYVVALWFASTALVVWLDNRRSGSFGASLSVAGLSSLTSDTVVFTTANERPTATSIVLQGDGTNATGLVFGQGVRCIVGAPLLKRLYVKPASGGSITAPVGGDLSVSAQSAALGDTIPAGAHRYSQVYYRDPVVLGGCPASSTFNATQALDLLWQ